ncbi:MAG: phosphoglycerate kinase [Chloroflexi bacterium]|nr:phosphoglycerate kinase [Chloroflexota bacterium]
MDRKTLADVDVRGKTVLLRADFNVPIAEGGPEAIASYDQRLRVTIPTIRYLIDRDCKVVLCSHLGRPKGKVVEELRMAPIAGRLSKLLSRPVEALCDCIGPEVEESVSQMQAGELVLLENLRFYPGEENNDPEFARALASLAEVFVLDAFGSAHRAHASIVGPPRYLPSAAGLLLQREVEIIGKALESPTRPLATVLGGAKASDKIKLLENLLNRTDALFIGGGMAATFLKAQGKPVGASLIEGDLIEYAGDLIARARDRSVALYLPRDVMIASEFSDNPSQISSVDVDHIPDRYHIMDIGPLTLEGFSARLSPCKTVIWNGPMGVFEYDKFAKGTTGLAKVLASLDATTIIGGGSTAEAVESLGLSDQMTHVSSGGGAMLEFLEGKELPGIAALPLKTPSAH